MRLLAAEAQLSVLAERSLLPPYGVCGGGAGAPNRFWVRRDGARVEPSPLPGKVSAFPLRKDDVVVMESSGGGGYGDPLERAVALVVADVEEGVVTPESAGDVYGVVLRGGVIDAAATATRRSELRAARPTVTLGVVDDLDERCTRMVRVDAATAATLGVGVGDVVELVNPTGAPVRLWIAAATIDDGARVTVSRDTLAMLGAPDAPVAIRRVYVARADAAM